jgi:heme-degrading monooxygenase HmoA
LRKEEYIMFARLTIVQGKPDKIDEMIQIYEESVVPAAKSQKGYQGAYMLVDRSTGKGVSISLWDSEEDARANEQSGYYQEQVGKFKDFFTAPPVQEGYEVAVQG